MENQSLTFVMLSPMNVNIMNLVLGGEAVSAFDDAKWKLAFDKAAEKHFWVIRVVVGGVEQVLSLPTVIYCGNGEDSEKAILKMFQLISFEHLIRDFSSIAVGSSVFFTEAKDYLGTFVLSEFFDKQELKRV